MKTCAKCGDNKPFSLFSNSAASKDGKFRICKECDKLLGAKRYADNSDRKKASAKAWHADNPERVKEIKSAYKERNKERLNAIERERQRIKRLADPEAARAKDAEVRAKDKEKILARAASWRARNIAHRSAYSAQKRAANAKATPKWANRFFIEEAYDLARRRTAATGVDWHVDHVIPLRSKLVCGLHVELNLQVITAKQNLRKHNKFEVR